MDDRPDMPTAFSTVQIATVVALAVLVGCVPAFQPILLGALHDSGRIDSGQIGAIATVEAIGMAVAASIAAALFQPVRLRAIACAAMLVVAIANLLTVISGVPGIFLGRALSGLASGVVLWILVGLMTRVANPGRIFALYVTCQGVVAFLLSMAMAQWIVPAGGAAWGYGALIALALLLLGPSLLVPAAYAPPAGGASRAAMPPPVGWLGLLGVVCFLAAVYAFWVYLPLLGAAQGFTPAAIGHAVGIGMAGQIAGGLAAILLAGRIGDMSAVVASAAIGILMVLVVGWTSSGLVLHGAILLFTLIWMFAPPFQLPLLMTLDRSNRSAMFVSSAQLAGMAAGPGLSALSLAASPHGPAWTSIALFGGAILLFLGARALRGGRATAQERS